MRNKRLSSLRTYARRFGRRLLKSERAAMTLTISQAFLGALTIGIAGARGTESYESFYFETQTGHANYAASKLGADHARSSNIVSTNNVISAAIIGPRFAVEADNLTMLVNAAIACPQKKNPEMAAICAEFKANYPRMLLKLAWVRVKQHLVWQTLSNLSTTIDKIAALRAFEQVLTLTRGIDAMVSMRALDPSMTLNLNLWATDVTQVACQNAMIDALPTPMVGSAFPILIHRNLVPGLPKALTTMMPSILCGAATQAVGAALSGGTPSVPKPPSVPGLPAAPALPKGPVEIPHPATDANVTDPSGVVSVAGGGVDMANAATCKGKQTEVLPMIPEVAKNAGESCDAAERDLRSAILAGGACVKAVSEYAIPPGGADPDADSHLAAAGDPEAGHARASRCGFDRKKCECDMLEKHSADMLAQVGLPRTSKGSASSLGGSTHGPTVPNWNASPSMRSCSYATKPIDPTIIQLNDATRTIMSFGAAGPSRTLRARHEYESCSRWYFPDGEGAFAGVPKNQQAYVGGWKYALVRGGGS